MRITAISVAGSSPIVCAGTRRPRKRDLDMRRIVDDMAVSKNQSIGSKDKPGAAAPALTRLARARSVQTAAPGELRYSPPTD